ncbi:stalk domain-containing protein [Pseudobacteroides cellulosolvens]|uniref:Copper amine oxidase-like domain-containing protein n=1 Tax=Pseudobacteroides cellulosolvens ATCC 35603 = DSM 2933 TaxID=398512 RepID=A0A0L6JQ49_9FIRM|nr:copper amine oxidase N-terminal domain-containing protein [Pseudobacteroides cellulosolvens]KNY27497.1 copper amine oxidase-like domain-containing protein [Pseudobacteroides cellulosolvens ATCC 35603 = DSM 2933]
MNRKITLTIIALLLSFMFSITANGNSFIKVTVNGKTVEFPDAQPFIDESGRTQVPARFVSQALGCTVEWAAATTTVTIKKGKDTIKLKVGESKALLNNVQKTFDTKARIKNSRTFVPLRFVSETLGAKVTWDSIAKTVIITTGTATTSIPADKEVISGYVVPKDPPSGLVVDGHENKKDYAELVIMIDFFSGDLEQMLKETESILLQKFDKKIVDDVMAYAKQKKVARYKLERKSFYVGDKIIDVVGVYNGPLDFYVYTK